MKCLVTGGAGFIGSHLVDLLIEHGHRVRVLDNLHGGRKSNLSSQAELRIGDIRDRHTVHNAIDGIDWVFHLAALADIVPSIEQPRAYFETNVDGTFNLLEAAKAAHVRRFIYAASSSCYGIPTVYPTPEETKISPQYPYALTKYLGEQLVLHFASVYKLPTLSLRLFNVYGPRAKTTGVYGAVFGVFLAQKLHGKPFTVVGDGMQTRDFTFVTDVTRAFLTAAHSQISGEVFNVGSGGHYSIQQLVQLLGGEVTYIPKRPGEPDCTFADISKITQALSWKPQIPFAEGVAKVVNEINLFQDAPIWEPASIQHATKTWFEYLNRPLA